MPHKLDSFAIVTVATNIYFDYWLKMAISADEHYDLEGDLKFHVFTDREVDLREVNRSLRKGSVCIHKIPPYRWPEATLLRYAIFSEANECINETHVMHLDADMKVNSKFARNLTSSKLDNGVGLVSHPGYWVPNARFENRLIRHVKQIFLGKLPRLGSWETDISSTAYVPQNLRKTYICGGAWLAENFQFKNICEDLAKSVQVDLENGKIAIWHDESHLNRWASENAHSLFEPSYCYVTTYKHLAKIPNIIEAIDKGDQRTRS